MIKTNGDLVSEIRHDLKALNKDDYVSARYILSKAYSYVDYIINNRPLSKLLRDRQLFTPVRCIPMKRIKKVECDIAELRVCDKIMRSVDKLPEMLHSSIGYLIEYVMNIVDGKEYEPLRNAKDFKDSKLREFGNVFEYYYIADSYLYVLNTTPERVNVSGAFKDEEDAKCLSDCDDDCDECKSKLDDKFVCPEEYQSTVKEQTLNVILNGHRKILEDEAPNLNSNDKGLQR